MTGENCPLCGRAVRVARVRPPFALSSTTVVAGFVLLRAASAHADPMTTSPEQGYDQGEIPAARAVGMGGALNALGVSTPALFLNPANLPLARVYHIEALGSFSPEAQRESFGAAIVDSVINAQRLAGGIGGTWNQMDPQGLDRVWTDVRAGLGVPLGDYLSLGMTGRYLHVEQHTAAGPFGQSYASDGTSSSPVWNGLTFDLGATALLGDFRLALVGHNLTNPATALAPTTTAFGAGYSSGIFAVEADGMADFTTFGTTTWRAMGGAELFLAGHYALRAGWRYDTGTQLNTPSLGLGYLDIQWAIEAAVRHDLESDHAATTGVLSLKYFYDATGAAGTPDDPDPL